MSRQIIQSIEEGDGEGCSLRSLKKVARGLHVTYVEKLLEPVEVKFDDEPVLLQDK